MFKLLTHKKRLVASLLLAFVFVPLFIPTGVASAAAVYPGTPQQPNATDNVCFGATTWLLGFVHQYCYPDMAACTAAWGTVPSARQDNPCLDNYSNRSGVEKMMSWVKQAPKTVGGAALDAAGSLIMAPIALLAQLINWIASIFLTSMAYVLDASIDRTINPNTYKYLTSVNVGWTAVRDISNMFFIFVLLYISIKTILGMADGKTKRWVAHIVIAALLINFSLFTTQVVIDAGNVLAVGFWDKISSKQGANTINSASTKFMEGFRIQTTKSNTNQMATSSGSKTLELDATHRTMIDLGGALVMFIAGYVFLAGAIMMIVRTVTLIILMIASPIAFLGFALPSGGGFAAKWLKKLIGATFVAPVFIFMLYLDSVVISNDAGKLTDASASGFSAAFSGSPDNFAIIYNFAVMIILLLASLTVSKSISDGVGDSAGGFAKKALGYGAGAVFVGGAIAGRQTAGRYGKSKTSNDEWVKKQNQLVAKAGMKDATLRDKASGRLANMKLASAQKASKGTFDIRNAPMGGLGITPALSYAGVNSGTASKKTFDTHGGVGSMGTEKEKGLLATAESRFTDPNAKKAYLEQKGVDLNALRNKDANAKLNRDIAKENAKEKLKTSKADSDKKDTDLAAGIITKDQADVIGKDISDGVQKAMQALTSNEIAELAPKHLDNPEFIKNLNASTLSAMQRFEVEGKYSEPIMKDVGAKIMNGDNAKQQEYLMKPETQGKLFNIDYEKIQNDGNLMDKYEKNIAELEKGRGRVANVAKAQTEAILENDQRDAIKMNTAFDKQKMADQRRADTLNAARDKQQASDRWRELFAKGAGRSPQEEAEFNGLRST